MILRIAATTSLIAFALCLLVGGLQADNTFATTVWRALLAMGATLIIGLIIGAMARAMLDENLNDEKKKLENSSPKSTGSDR